MECRFGQIVGAPFAGALDSGIPDSDANSENSNIQTPEVQMQLNQYGVIAYNEWIKLPERFTNFEFDVFQIVPNHVHGIVILTETPVGAGFTPALHIDANIDPNAGTEYRAGVNPAPTTTPKTNATLGDIIGAYKSLVANACLDIYKLNNETMGKLWQRNYHEHIIRDEQSYWKISNYIINNPVNWQTDKFYKP
jgi:putative transposase